MYQYHHFSGFQLLKVILDSSFCLAILGLGNILLIVIVIVIVMVMVMEII